MTTTYINVLDLAASRSPALAARLTDDDGPAISGEELAAVGVHLTYSCAECGATIGVYNAWVDTDRTHIIGGCCK